MMSKSPGDGVIGVSSLIGGAYPVDASPGSADAGDAA
jgi:hypothetical protein